MKNCNICLVDKELSAFDESKKGNGCYRKTCRKCRNNKNQKSYYSKEGNIEKMKEYRREYQKKHRKENPYYQVYCQCLWQLKSKVKTKKNNEIKIHLESLFTSDMNWSNYGTYWEIDHIVSAIKMAKAGYDIDDINKLSNLRPMVVTQNRERSKLV
jgi:hypothetical protein